MECKLRIGDRAEFGTVYRINEDGLHGSHTIQSIVEDRRVVIFGGPAPFSRLDTQQATEYAELSDELLKYVQHVYGIYCQDAFVLKQFEQHITRIVPTNKVIFHADGDAFWTRSQQLEHDFTFQGLGVRSGRYAMVLDDGEIEHIALDDFSEIETTAAAKILEYLKKA